MLQVMLRVWIIGVLLTFVVPTTVTAEDASNAQTASSFKTTLKQIFQDDFNRPDGTEIGPGWKQSAHYGPISGSLRDHHFEIDLADGSTIPWSSATLNLTDPKVIGRGLNVGEYFDVQIQRLTDAGALGIELYDSDQLRQGSGNGAGESPLQAWNGKTWVPITIDEKTAPVAYDWKKPHTLGVRFDSADGKVATFSYFIDDHYAGSLPIKIGWKTLDKIGVFAQTRTSGPKLQFTKLTVYGAK